MTLTTILLLLTALAAAPAPQAASIGTETLYISGTGSDNTVDWNFYFSAGRGSGRWTTIPVPSCWECQGFGQYVYGTMPQEDRIKESGIYRHEFTVPAEWKGKSVDIVFEGVMTDTEVKINGKPAGPTHQGGYCEFRYDVSQLLRYGRTNSIEVKVDKASSNQSVEEAERECDFWTYGGIYRPVYLEAKPAAHIEDIAIDAKADGSIRVKALVEGRFKNADITAKVIDNDGKQVGETLSLKGCAPGEYILSGNVSQPLLWSAEFPNLYNLTVTLQQDGRILHETKSRFGFRTIELRPHDGVYVNGTKIRFKGVNRHSHWPTTGRTLNHSINLQDALLIKEMNMNAVRMSHYPPEKDFLDICDSLGLYVLDEITGWQTCYDDVAGAKLVHELVSRDKNHPSILFWDNGNEGGFNFNLVPRYAEEDFQQRQVIHPWEKENGWNTYHYPGWDEVHQILTQERNVYFPTECIHGLYDGGHGAGLEDYWKLITSYPLGAGCFLWDLVDQGLVRDDMDGFIDTDGDHAADGILGPYREKEGSFYTIKDIWSPVQLEGSKYLPPYWNGQLTVSNCYSFTNLNQCSFSAEFSKIDFISGKTESRMTAPASPDVAPGMKGILTIQVPDNYSDYDFLTIKAVDPHGMELYSWTRTITSAAEYASRVTSAGNDGVSIITGPDGLISGLKCGGSVLPLTNGPCLVPGNSENSKVEFGMTDNGWVEVSYAIDEDGLFDNIGVTFDFPEDMVKGVRWLGNGPYRVWKNRLRGAEPGLWTKEYNDARTGQSCDYPEFKGYHSGMYAADIMTDAGILRLVSDTDDLYLHLLTPAAQGNGNLDRHFPDGNISILNAISPIGTKFCPPSEMGPSGQKTKTNIGHGPNAVSKGHFYMTFIPWDNTQVK